MDGGDGVGGTGDGLARLALGAGLLAVLVRLSAGVGALAWPVVVLGTGLWLAALWEARARRKVSNPVLWAGAAMLAAGALIPA